MNTRVKQLRILHKTPETARGRETGWRTERPAIVPADLQTDANESNRRHATKGASQREAGQQHSSVETARRRAHGRHAHRGLVHREAEKTCASRVELIKWRPIILHLAPAAFSLSHAGYDSVSPGPGDALQGADHQGDPGDLRLYRYSLV
jgi:hypothetical protein